MVEISAEDVRKLRDQTGGKMMDCKNALVESGGSLEKAVELLRKKGLASAEKKAGREAKDGLVYAHILDGQKIGTLVEVACETDFVARNDDFKAFVKQLAAHVVASPKRAEIIGPEQTASLLQEKWQHDPSRTIEQVVKDLIAKLGENVVVRRCARFQEPDAGRVFSYIHHTNKLGVLVDVGCSSEPTAKRPEFTEFLKEIAMHIAAAMPRAEYLSSEEVPAEALDRERRIARESDALKGKPAQVLDKIIEGKIAAFLKGCVVTQQPWIKDDSKTIAQLTKELSAKLGETIVIRRFARFEIGA